MSSFYGNGGGTSSKVINSLNKKAKRHIVASESEPFDQQIGDLWLVLEKDENENKTRVDLTYNIAEGIFEGQIETGIMTAAQLEEGYDFYGEIDGNEVSFIVAEITDQPDCTLIKLFSPMVEGIVECGYYYKTGRITKRLRAILDDGLLVNIKLKALTGSLPMEYYSVYIRYKMVTDDSKVQNIEFVDNLFNDFEPTEINTISSNESDIPIYTKWDNTNKTINIYSEVNELQCNQNSMRYFLSQFKMLSSSVISSVLEKINYSNVENITNLVSGTKITTIPTIMRDNLHVKNMTSIFSSCKSLTDISSFSEIDISQVTSFSGLFSGCESLTDISSFSEIDTSQVTSFSSLFAGCKTLTNLSPLTNCNTSKVTDMYNLFGGRNNLKMNINNIQALENWDVSNVTSMYNMFSYNESLIDISPLENWNVSKVEDFQSMFSNTGISDISSLENWNVSSATNMSYMFYNDTNLTNISFLANWDVSNVTNMTCMLANTGITDISSLINWDISKLNKMTNLFSSTAISDISVLQNWDISNVTDLYGLFVNCSSLSDISALENWNISNVTNLGNMFKGCNLITASLPNWDIRKVTVTNSSYVFWGLGSMFANNPNLEQVYLTNWDFSNVRQMTNMFENTPNLQHVYVSQASYDSFLRAVENGCNITDMWKNSNISQFTIIDS